MASESHRRAARAYQLRHRAAGLCTICSMPRVTANHCREHAQKINDINAVKRSHRAPHVHRCSVCGVQGHNRKTCEEATRGAQG